jgi:AcrR family transcriptional regulator
MMGKKEKVIAHGNVARQINKNLRRERIFNIAKNQIAKNGLEAFTIAELAQEAGVSTPTIHNLFGKKSDIIKELVSNLIEYMQSITLNPPIDPIENTKFFVNNVAAAFEKDINFYRAALMSAEHLKLFDPRIPGGPFQQAQQLAAPRKEWYESGLLLGNVEPSIIMKKVHDSNRLARIDWVLGYIDLNQFRHKAMKGILLVYAADASPELHVLLIEEINRLNSL